MTASPVDARYTIVESGAGNAAVDGLAEADSETDGVALGVVDLASGTLLAFTRKMPPCHAVAASSTLTPPRTASTTSLPPYATFITSAALPPTHADVAAATSTLLHTSTEAGVAATDASASASPATNARPLTENARATITNEYDENTRSTRGSFIMSTNGDGDAESDANVDGNEDSDGDATADADEGALAEGDESAEGDANADTADTPADDAHANSSKHRSRVISKARYCCV